MASTSRNRKVKRAPRAPAAGDMVVSIRLSREILEQLDELAAEMERSRANVLQRAVRQYVEDEYSRLVDLREAERELNAGKGIPHDQVGRWVEDLKARKGRPKELR